jgi:hypothetical protein
MGNDLESSAERRRISIDELIEIGALEQLHRNERRAVLIVAEVMDRNDVRMVKTGDGPGLMLESLPQFVVED